jgi:tetratricopeptide (TPR) repeat protein
LAEVNLAEDTAEGAMRAEPFARQSLAAWRAMNHAYNVAWSAARLSEICRLQNKLDEAKSYTDEALPLFQSMGDQQAVCFRLQGLAQIARARGDITEARRRIAASLTLAHDLHSRPAVLRALSELIAMALAEHNHAHASVLLGAIDARRAFLSDALSRMVCDDLERQVIEACAQTNVDSVSNRAHGAAMSVRELTMIIIDKG